ncbi:hypothetical protein Tco_0923344 [Tanacetum coccineum]|uniref:Uncharacterized protein n=1 Tax=Tanacetum coccineum TaxID=301880 RepID=A0ABQ5D0Q0_9ASTR
MAFNEFNYLLKVDPELFTYDIERTENYDDYMNEFNDEFEEPWDEDGVPYEIGDHICEPFCFKNGRTKWPICSSNEDGFCNVIMEYLVKISKKARILELKRRHLKITILTSYTPYPSRKIRRICAFTSQKTTKETSSIAVPKKDSIYARIKQRN